MHSLCSGVKGHNLLQMDNSFQSNESLFTIRRPKLQNASATALCSLYQETSQMVQVFKMIWVHKDMIATGASELQMQKGASSGLSQADEQQSQ